MGELALEQILLPPWKRTLGLTKGGCTVVFRAALATEAGL